MEKKKNNNIIVLTLIRLHIFAVHFNVGTYFSNQQTETIKIYARDSNE